MTIVKMTATFGKLSREVLKPEAGLSVFTLPNESGKSTWTSFLLAMFYGVNTAERSSKTNMAVKTRYKPWSGEGMSGAIELIHEGRKITIERTAHQNVPFGAFRAYDTETGQDIPELTAENCGEVLLGCEKSVFMNSALLQGELAVGSDDALTRRLTQLVTSGSETISYADTHKTLHTAANRIKNTLLPQAQKALEAADEAIRKIREQHGADLRAEEEKAACERERTELSAVLEALDYEDFLQKKKTLQDAEQALAVQEATAAALLEQTKALPEEGVLRELEKSLSEKPMLPEKPTEFEENPAFAGLSAKESAERSRADAAEYDRLLEKRQKPLAVWIVLGALCLAAAPVGTILLKTYWALLALAPAAFFTARAIKTLTENKIAVQQQAAAQAILEQYGVASRDEILTAGAANAAAKQAYAEQEKQYEAALTAERERMARLMGSVWVFRPDCKDERDALDAVREALGQYDALARAEQALALKKERCDMIAASLGAEVAPPRSAVNTAGQTRQGVLQKMADCEQRLKALEGALARSAGAVEALGDPAELAAQSEQLRQQIAALSERQAALELAEKTLEDANAQLQTRFSPQLCMLAGTYLEKLTQNRYDALTLDTAMRVTAHETEGALTRDLPYLSSGTVDQVYFALRLAIAELALRGDTPIILDDALLRFDDERLRAALELLREQSKQRQILLFSCHSREERLLKGETL